MACYSLSRWMSFDHLQLIQENVTVHTTLLEDAVINNIFTCLHTVSYTDRMPGCGSSSPPGSIQLFQ